MALLVVLVLVPLAFGSVAIARDEQLAAQARPITQDWARAAGWQVSSVDATNGALVVTAIGPPPEADVATLRRELNDAGMSGSDLTIRLIVGGSRFCPANGTTCEEQ